MDVAAVAVEKAAPPRVSVPPVGGVAVGRWSVGKHLDLYSLNRPSPGVYVLVAGTYVRSLVDTVSAAVGFDPFCVYVLRGRSVVEWCEGLREAGVRYEKLQEAGVTALRLV